jgi:transcriptional regulator with XRE-family HTH domain
VDAAVGGNLRTLREAAGLTQADLAARMTTLGTEWTASNVSLVEAGKRKLSQTGLADLCRVLGVPVTAFYGTDGAGGSVAERLAALGGTEVATSQASPIVADDDEAALVARQRLATRVLDRVVKRVPWDRDDIAVEDLREIVLDSLLELYDTRDILEVRDQLAHARASAVSYGFGGEVITKSPTLDDIADARAWATRRIIEQVSELLDDSASNDYNPDMF